MADDTGIQAAAPAAGTDAGIAVGQKVRARWPEDGKWYAGTVTETRPGAYHVAFDDGDAGWIEAAEVKLLSAAIGIGEKVRAKWAQTGNWYHGTVTELREGQAHVQFVDGDSGWIPLTDVRPR